MLGRTFSRLLVVEEVRPNPRHSRPKLRFRCLCACSRSVVVIGEDLRSGNTRSCGCLIGEANVTHGLSREPIYNIWKQMRARCENPKNKRWEHYGHRGIEVCKRWKSFADFYADMGPRPSSNHQLDRKDNNGDYEPGNCRWATRDEQAANTSRSVLVRVPGGWMTVAEAARLLRLSRNVILKLYGRTARRAYG